MTIPSNKELYLPILIFFSDNEIHNKKEVYEKIVDYFNLTEDDLNQTIEDFSISKFKRRFNLVLSNFVRSNCLVRKGNDNYFISPIGLELCNSNSSDIIEEHLKKPILKTNFNDSMNITIKNCGAIVDSSIDIKRINIIGGQNATGKSTASKLLYCFLKYCSINRQNDAYESVIIQIQNLVRMMRRLFRRRENAKYAEFIKLNYYKFMNNDDIYDILDRYEQLKDIVFSGDFSDSNMKNRIFEEIREIDDYIEVIEEDGEYLFNLIMNDSFDSEFSNKIKGCVEFKGLFEGNSFKITSKFNENYNYNNEGELLISESYEFNRDGEFVINEIFYIDSFSSLDINQSNSLINSSHVQSLLKAIEEESDESNDLFDSMKNTQIKKLLNDINELIEGKFHYEDNELKFSEEYGLTCYMNNTSSGIKQIGIIQLLLANRKLKRNSFLIIDEPEVNLHPHWQVRLAEILTILAKELNIYIYINTHSPMLIEAMAVFAEYYELLDETKFYLTEKHEDSGFFFKNITHNNLGAVYGNLAYPYDELDKIKALISKRV